MDNQKKEVNFVPNGNYVLIEPYKPIRKVNGLFIPDIAVEMPCKGVVAAVGADVKNYQQGQHIIFGQYSGTKIDVTDTELYLIMRETDIFGRIPNPTPPSEEETNEE